MPRIDRHPFLMSGLLEGWDWFDNGLQNLVKDGGFRPLNKSQSMMVLYVSAGVTRPSDIARKMRLSRQAIRHIANQLIAQKILLAHDDPADGRSVILGFTQRSTGIREFARNAIRDLEDVLRSRIGGEDYAALKRVLNLDWGKVVKRISELPSGAHTATSNGKRRRKAKKPRRKI
ncbi:MAG TPA: helix-turn-helix domain-containing protein [Rhizomicrobium sp.]|nr:helix-turn-helix domain-containing protein [Rhizomicrobium sp.]